MPSAEKLKYKKGTGIGVLLEKKYMVTPHCEGIVLAIIRS